MSADSRDASWVGTDLPSFEGQLEIWIVYENALIFKCWQLVSDLFVGVEEEGKRIEVYGSELT